MKYEIKNRLTQEAQYTAEIDCDEGVDWRVKRGLAVKIAFNSGADLCGADLSGAYLCNADLRGADLRGAYLCGAYLCDADLRGADLCGAYLCNADLRGADLRGADLCNADLCGADLCGAYLCNAYLRNANLCNADLRGADLCNAYLCNADLRGADLCNADMGGLILLARATRSDSHEYFAWSSILGGMVITAGCRTWVGEDAIEQARKHCQTTTSERYRTEALRIVDFIEGAATALRREAA